MLARRKLTEKGERDFVLVKKALEQNDQKAYTELFNKYRNSVHYLLYKMTNNRLEAEELMIEAFGNAYQNLNNYRPEYAFSTWLFKIATNSCIDYMRAKSKQCVSVRFDGDLNYKAEIKKISSGIGPEEKLIKKQRAEMLKKIIRQMKPKYRKVIELRYFKEYSMDEIEKTLQIPVGTIKAQLFRGKAMLFKTLNKQMELHY